MADDPLNLFITRLDGRGARRVGVKDLFDTRDIRTTYGSRIYADHVPDADATAVRRLVDGGWSLAGKTNLHEFAFGATSDNPWYGPARNPHDPRHVAGGSSGGSASGLVDGSFELGLGTDTAGSIRIPASACGVVGFKPSFGAVPIDGCFPLTPWLDHVGPLARDVPGCVEAFAALAGRTPAPPLDPSSLTIGAMRQLDHVEPAIAAAYLEALDRIREAGARVEPLDLPALPPAGLRLRLVAAAHVHRATYPSRAADYGADLRLRLDRGREPLSHLEALALRDEVDAWKREVARVAAPFELLAMPTLPIGPPLVGADPRISYELVRHTEPFNHLGWPAISLPCGRDAAGLPVGLQLAGRDDDVVQGAALRLEPTIRAAFD